MGEPLGSYNLKVVNLIIDSIDISGYGESGGIEFEGNSEPVVPLVGAIGNAAVSFTNNYAASVTLTVLESSRSYADLAELQQRQLKEAQEGPVNPLNFLMEDPINGDSISDQYAVFLTHPMPNKAATIGERAFSIFLPTAFDPDTAKYGVNNKPI